MIISTRETLSADRVMKDIAEVLATASHMARGGAAIGVAAELNITPDELLATAREVGIEQIHRSMSLDMRPPKTINRTTMEHIGFSVGAYVAAGAP